MVFLLLPIIFAMFLFTHAWALWFLLMLYLPWFLWRQRKERKRMEAQRSVWMDVDDIRAYEARRQAMVESWTRGWPNERPAPDPYRRRMLVLTLLAYALVPVAIWVLAPYWRIILLAAFVIGIAVMVIGMTLDWPQRQPLQASQDVYRESASAYASRMAMYRARLSRRGNVMGLDPIPPRRPRLATQRERDVLNPNPTTPAEPPAPGTRPADDLPF